MSETVSNALLEEYKTVRNTIFEADKRINSLTIYIVLSTATILGFAIQYPSNLSPLLFLLPVTIIFPLGHKIRRMYDSILWTGTYIMIYIESKHKDLNYETFLKKIRLNREENRKWTNGIFNYLLFDALVCVCIAGSFFSTVSFDYNISNLVSNIDMNSISNYVYSNNLLILFWFIIVLCFIDLSRRMSKSYTANIQKKFEKEIANTIDSFDDLKENTI